MRLARVLAIATPLFALAFYGIGGALKPGYSHLTHFISELNATGTPWAQALGWLGFVPLGLLFAAFLLAVGPVARVSGPSRLGLWLLWSQPAALVGAALMPCDAGCPVGGSISQHLHDLLGLTTYPAGALGLFLLAFARGRPTGRVCTSRSRGWRGSSCSR